MSQCVHCKRHHVTGEAKELCRQLHNERQSHAVTRQELDRVWRLTPRHYIPLMGVYRSLRQLLHVLAEAADLQDPSRGAPIEDTMRVEFVHVGEHASSSQPELGEHSHRQHRANVAEMDRQLAWVTDRLSRLIPGSHWEYSPPSGECPECGKLIYQNDTGRKRTYCSNRCRVRASRKVEV